MTITTLGTGHSLDEGEGQLSEQGEVSATLKSKHPEHSGEHDVQLQTALISNTATTLLGESEEQERERQLNAGCSREIILRNGNCELIQLTEKLTQAFQNLRRGYPDKPFEEQCQGAEFRENSDLIITAIAEQTMRGLDPDKVVVLMPWRAGLAFARGYLKQGVRKFYHVSSRRDEQTLETIVDYESGKVAENDTVIIADPMLATGNTVSDAMRRIIESGLPPEQIVVNAVVAAPAGVQMANRFPAVRVVTGALDEKLDHRGYIVEGLGDFGDKYCGDLTEPELTALATELHLDPQSYQKLLERFRAHGN